MPASAPDRPSTPERATPEGEPSGPAARREGAAGSRGITLQRFLARLVLLCTAPLLILAIVLAAQRVLEEQRTTHDRADRVAKNLAAAVDQHLASRIGALEYLASSIHAGDPSGLPALYEHARLLRDSIGGQIILGGTDGRMRFHTGLPFGAPLPPLPRPAGRAAADVVARSGEPAVGDLFMGPIQHEPLVAIVAPGPHEGDGRLLVLRVAGAREFVGPLDRVARATAWTARLLDSRGEAIASVGATPSDDVEPSARRVSARLTQAPWSVAVDVPADEMERPWRRAMAALGLAVVATAVVTLAGGFWASQRLARAVRAVAEPHGQPPAVAPIHELLELQATLERAAREREQAVEAHLAEQQAHAADLGRAAMDMQVREGQLRGIFDSAADAILTCDGSHRIGMANPAAARMFATTVDELVGLPLEELVPERFRGPHRLAMERLATKGVTSRAMGAGRDLVGVRRDGREFPIDAGISHVRFDGQELFTVIVSDVTERRHVEAQVRHYHEELARSHEQLRRLLSVQDRIQDDERKRIARELHDDLQQSLAGILLDVHEASEVLARDPAAAAAIVEGIGRLAGGALASTRRIVEDLRPQMLEVLGLPAALEALGAGFARRTKLACTVVCDDVDPAGQDDAQVGCLYRVAQEALNNVAKHAGAQRVAITLAAEGDTTLRLTIADDGAGMAVGARDKHRSYGLLGMEERVRAAGGQLHIHSAPGAGTTVTVAVPRTRPAT